MTPNEIRWLIDNSEHEKVVGLIGENPSTYSKSRVMWNAVYVSRGIDAEYIPFDVHPSDLTEVLDLLLTHDKLLGFNVTNPYKEPTACHPLIEVDKLAKMVGGVNTVHKVDGKIYGHSTDGYGAVTPLQEHTNIEGKNVLVLGAGGSGCAVAVACAEEGGKTYIANRTYAKAKSLSARAKEYGKKITPIHLLDEGGYSEPFLSVLGKSDIVINTLPFEKNNSKPIFTKDELAGKKKVCMDIVYGHRSYFLESALKEDHIAIDGRWMLLHQAVKAFEYVHASEQIPKKDITNTMKYAVSNIKFDASDEDIMRSVIDWLR